MTKTKERIIAEYLAKIGSTGGKSRAERHSKKTLSRWAKLGGRPPKKGKKSQ